MLKIIVCIYVVHYQDCKGLIVINKENEELRKWRNKKIATLGIATVIGITK